MRFLRSAHHTAPAGNIEGNGYDVAFFDKFNVPTRFNDFSRNFMPEHQAVRGRRAASDHVLVASANVCGNYLQNHPVLTFPIHIRLRNAGPVPQD